MKMRAVSCAAALVAALGYAACGGHGGPTEPPATGVLKVEDSGCSCGVGPFSPIPIYIDGTMAGSLPLFGEARFALSPGKHTWSYDSPAAPAPITIVAGQTLTENLYTVIDCPGGECPTDPDPGDS